MVFLLPWWVSVYLVIVLIISLGSAVEDYKTNQFMAFGSVLSFVFITVFVIGYFYPSAIAGLGFALIPMVLGGLVWEFFSAITDISKGRAMLDQEAFLDDEEKQGILDFAIIMNALVILPGYIVGLKLCVDLITGAGGA